MGDLKVEVALHLGAEHAEGPLWDAETARLWWVDITRQRVHCFDPTSGCDSSWPTSGQPGGVVLDSAGIPVVAMPDGLATLDRATGRLDRIVPIEANKPENRANDAKVDSTGRVWVGTMAYDKRPENAALYRVDRDVVTRVVDRLTISNGPAFDEDEGRLYLADTALGRVDVFDFDLEVGVISNRRRFLDFSDRFLGPDGMTVDDDGMLWIAVARAGAVHRYARDGRLDGVIELPVTNPTSVAFAGSDLYITSSWIDLAPEERPKQPLAGAIFRCHPGTSGRGSPRYVR